MYWLDWNAPPRGSGDLFGRCESLKFLDNTTRTARFATGLHFWRAQVPSTGWLRSPVRSRQGPRVRAKFDAASEVRRYPLVTPAHVP